MSRRMVNRVIATLLGAFLVVALIHGLGLSSRVLPIPGSGSPQSPGEAFLKMLEDAPKDAADINKNKVGLLESAGALVTAALPNIAQANKRRLKAAKMKKPGLPDDDLDSYVITPDLAIAAAMLANNTYHTPAGPAYRNKALALKEGHWGVSSTGGGEYWMPGLTMNGVVSNTTETAYKVWRNVRQYGAKGDGKTDDTKAINDAIRHGNRCGRTAEVYGSQCSPSEDTPAVIYFPPGTYLISGSIDVYYNTQLLGDPLNRPTIMVAKAFLGYAAIRTDLDDSRVPPSHAMRSVRNFVVDMTNAPPANSVIGIHWHAMQASDIRDVDIFMQPNTSPEKAAANTQIGIYLATGRAGFLSNVYMQGGRSGLVVRVEHFTVRHLIVADAHLSVLVAGRSQGGTDLLHSLTVVTSPGTFTAGTREHDVIIGNRVVGVAVDGVAGRYISRGSLLMSDSTFVGVPVAVYQAGFYNADADSDTANYLAFGENVVLRGTGPEETLRVPTWRLRVKRDRPTPKYLNETYVAELIKERPSSLVVTNGTEGGDGSKWLSGWWPAGKKGDATEPIPSRPWFSRNAPTYTDPMDGGPFDIVSIKSLADGKVKGDGQTDDTAALNEAFAAAAAARQVVFVPYGVYVVTDTVHIPVGSRIVGQAWATIEGRGPQFEGYNNGRRASNITTPSSRAPSVVQVGQVGDFGIVEISDMAFALEKGAPNSPRAAPVVEWNIHGGNVTADAVPDAPKQGSAAMWNCHIRRPDNVVPLQLTQASSAYLENIGVSTNGASAAYADVVVSSENDQPVGEPDVFTDIVVDSLGPTWLWGGGSMDMPHMFNVEGDLFTSWLGRVIP